MAWRVGTLVLGSALIATVWAFTLPGEEAATVPGATLSPTAAPFTPTSEPARWDDPAGDAADHGVGDPSGTLGLPDGVPALGPKAPHFDIVGVSYDGEDREHLRFTLEIAELSEGFAELAAPDGVHRMATYEVCWAPSEGDGCTRSATLTAMRHGEQAHTEARLDLWSQTCNEWRWCNWGVDHEVTFGAPAAITFTVPKAYATYDGAPPTIHHVEAWTTAWTESNAFPMWHPGVTVHTPAYHFHTHGGSVGAPTIADRAGPGLLEAAYVPHDAMPAVAPDAPLLVGHPGAPHGDGGPYDHPEMDLLAFDAYEDAGDLVARFVVAAYRDDPAYDFDYSVAIGVGDEVWEVGYRHEGGEYYGYTGRCVMETCPDPEIYDAHVEVLPGAPASILVRTPLALLDEPEAGTATNLFWAMTMVSDVNYYWGEHDSEFYGDYHSVFMVDALFGGQPYVFGSGHRATVTGGHLH